MKVFITGASGFVGSNLVRALLEKGDDISIFVLPNDPLDNLRGLEDRLNIMIGDLGDTAELTRQLRNVVPDACVHLAWYAEPGDYLRSPKNLVALQNSLSLLQILADTGCEKVIMAGTCAEYDLRVGYLSEESPTRAETIYAASKLAMSILGHQFSQHLGIHFTWARIFYLYGPNENPRRFVPAAILAIKSGLEFSSTPGEQVRDYLHVADVAAAFVHLLENSEGGIYNISSGRPVTIRKILELIAQIMQQPDLMRLGALPYREWEPMFVCGDNRRLRSLGWKPVFSLEQGLKQTCDWWQNR